MNARPTDARGAHGDRPGPANRNSVSPGSLDSLERGLRAEGALLRDLAQALVRQRAGVAASDVEAVQAGSDRVSEVMSALSRARAERHAVLERLAGEPVPALTELETRLAAPLPRGLDEARAELVRLAHRAADELSINRSVIRRAIERGDTFLRLVVSQATDGVQSYAEPSARPAANNGPSVLFNKVA